MQGERWVDNISSPEANYLTPNDEHAKEKDFDALEDLDVLEDFDCFDAADCLDRTEEHSVVDELSS